MQSVNQATSEANNNRGKTNTVSVSAHCLATANDCAAAITTTRGCSKVNEVCLGYGLHNLSKQSAYILQTIDKHTALKITLAGLKPFFERRNYTIYLPETNDAISSNNGNVTNSIRKGANAGATQSFAQFFVTKHDTNGASNVEL